MTPTGGKAIAEELKSAVGVASEELERTKKKIAERQFETVLEKALKRSHGGTVRRQASIKLDSWHGRLGGVDLAVESESGAKVLIELKWGGRELWNCAWDCVKLATALAEGASDLAYLIAGAQAKDWSDDRRGAELFGSKQWGLEEFLAAYRSDFVFWRKDIKCYPKALAGGFATRQIAAVPARLGSTEWEVRIAQIKVTDSSLVPIEFAPVVVHSKGARNPE